MGAAWADITGRGVVSSAGHTVEDFARSILAGEGHVGPFAEDNRPPPRNPEDAAKLNLRFINGAPIRDFDPNAHFDEKTLGGVDRFTQFAAVAARQAWKEAGLDHDPPPPGRIAVIVGTANGGHDILDQGWRRLLTEGRKPTPLTIPMSMVSAPASRIAREIGAQGPVFAMSSACASAAHAIMTGLMLLRSGAVDVVVAGGTDTCFNFGYLRVWDVLRVVSPDVCRPFSKGRRGMILGEGAGIVVLEAPGRAAARGAKVLARLAGGGMTSDASDLTTPDGHGMARAVRAALDDSGLAPESIGYINAHGTGTIVNDRAEATAIREIFGAATDRMPVSSTKAAIGHAMGASGALELMVAIAALDAQIAPPTLNFLEADPACEVDVVAEGPRPIQAEAALSNSFAFGGLNVTLAVARADMRI